ncbi:Hypothetical protein AA314_09076 [Archangium gephyra]|uniref:Uncharacterized protein n=1 Tax=Archangium gephyra TaxID=48 RepID=A0AAC8QH75_9BACT|nr:Hypothetical protein AA314_09076 [Archangium gephyra]
MPGPPEGDTLSHGPMPFRTLRIGGGGNGRVHAKLLDGVRCKKSGRPPICVRFEEV